MLREVSSAKLSCKDRKLDVKFPDGSSASLDLLITCKYKILPNVIDYCIPGDCHIEQRDGNFNENKCARCNNRLSKYFLMVLAIDYTPSKIKPCTGTVEKIVLKRLTFGAKPPEDLSKITFKFEP